MMAASVRAATATSFEQLDLAPPLVKSEPTIDGFILSSPVVLEPYGSSLGEMLRWWSAEDPDRAFLAERRLGTDGWRRMSYGEANAAADALGQALLDRGLGPASPLMILSGNSIDHALLMLGGLVAGVPVVPVSVAYSLLSEDFAKLKHIAALVRPGAVYAEEATTFGRALAAVDFDGAEIVASRGQPPAGAATPLTELLATHPDSALEEAFRAVGPDSVAKVLFTSGSTDMPKGVINTHRMLCSNQQALAQIWPFTAATPPVLLDWLPWNHTFGGNHNFNLILKRGGTLYIDGGRPTPDGLEQTLRNLHEVSPTILFNVPAGYAQLVGRLERDAGLRERVFARLQVIFYAGAALPEDVWVRMNRVAAATRGKRIFMTSSWGMTETAPICTAAHFATEHSGNIGIPVPGVAVRMVRNGETHELRIKGPNVTPGYLGRADLTAEAFDEDGWYRSGDAGRLLDAEEASKGLFFDGRIAEDFKLSSGTFVRVGTLRVAVLSATAPVLQDLVIVGQDCHYITLLAWPALDGSREVAGDDAPEDLKGAAASAAVAAFVRERLAEHNARQRGSSTRVRRALLMSEPPSSDANEITDKGYINQRAVLRRRTALVEELYAEPPDPRVIVVE